MSDKVKSRFVSFGTGPDQVNGRDIPANFTPANYVPSQVAAEGTDKVSAHLKGIDFDLANITPENILYVKKNPRVGEFSSVKTAIDSITTASSTNLFAVLVGPGIFVEDQIVMQSFVILQGIDDSVTIITANDPTQPLIIGKHNSEIKYIQLRGPTDPGVPLIYYTGTSASGSTFSVIESAFQDADLIYQIENNNTFPTSFRTEGCRLTSSPNVGSVLKVTGSNSQPVFAFLSEFIYRQLAGPYPTHIFDVSGPQSQVVLNQVLVGINNVSTHGVHIEDGANVDIISSAFTGMGTGLHVHNVGAGSKIQTSNLVIRDCVTDIQIDHPGTTGSLSGVAATSKIIIDDSADVTVSMADLEDGGVFFSGPLRLGRKHSYITDDLDLLEGEPSMGVMDGGALTDGGGLDLDVSAGFGYAMVSSFPDHRIRKITWTNSTITLGANQDVYIFFNNSGVLSSSASISNSAILILLGRVVTNATGIELIDESPLHTHHPVNHLDQLLREALGPIYDSGSIVTENVTPLKLDVTSGVYFFSLTRFTPVGGTAISFTEYQRDGLGGWITSTTDLVENTGYDNDTGGVTPFTAGYYAKHSLYVNGDGANQSYFMVMAQAEYSALAAVEDAPLPSPPSWIKDGVVPIASIVVRQGQANIIEVLDLRPRIGFRSSGISASSDHGSLLGLADDDHLQYLLGNGSRAMSGNLDMGGNSITNINLVDGIDVTAHASRHLPNGADPITTAIAIGMGANTANSIGIANSLSRSDHQHALSTGVVSTQTPAQANAAGVSANLARADHVHNIPVGTPVTVSTTNSEGAAATFARSDHVHDHGTLAGGDRHAVATGSIAGFMSATDKTKLDGISGARIVKSGRLLFSDFTGSPKTATVTFGAAFPNTNYVFTISGTDTRSWTWQNKLAGSIVINANANQVLTGDVHWFAIDYGESVE